MPAPIVVFAYNRPDHLQRTLTALRQNPLADQSDLFIYCDGAKAPHQQATVDATRAVADAITGFAKITVIKRESNWGLAKNIVDGVTQIVQDYGRIIVVEDDILTSPHFLTYMNGALDLYDGNPKVACISGWCFPHDVPNPPETFFLKGADCWGWATWADKWAIYNPDAEGMLKNIRHENKAKEFDIGGHYDYTAMLRDAARGRNNSWAIRWYASAFLRDMYCLYPGYSLVKNIGLDGSGTHCGNMEMGEQVVSHVPTHIKPSAPTVDITMLKSMQKWLRNNTGSRAKKIVLDYLPWLRPLKKKIGKIGASFL